MTRLRFFYFFLCIFFFQISGFAENNFSLRKEEVIKNSFIIGSGQFSRFSTDEGSIQGSGVKASYFHVFNKQIALDIFFSTALSGSKNVSNSFTGLGAYVYYNLLGDCCDTNQKTFVDERQQILDFTQANNTLFLGAGVDQYYLNGAKTIYSASGLGLAVKYQFSLFNWRWETTGQYSLLNSGSTKLNGLMLSAGIVFPL